VSLKNSQVCLTSLAPLVTASAASMVLSCASPSASSLSFLPCNTYIYIYIYILVTTNYMFVKKNFRTIIFIQLVDTCDRSAYVIEGYMLKKHLVANTDGII
jgi:hypothetical protein